MYADCPSECHYVSFAAARAALRITGIYGGCIMWVCVCVFLSVGVYMKSARERLCEISCARARRMRGCARRAARMRRPVVQESVHVGVRVWVNYPSMFVRLWVNLKHSHRFF